MIEINFIPEFQITKEDSQYLTKSRKIENEII